jgi:hypothetical protein
MLRTFSLWFGLKLIKFAAGKDLEQAMPKALSQLNLDIPSALVARDQPAVERAFKVAGAVALGRPLNPLEEEVASLLWQPQKAIKTPRP